ncbi:DUF6221 family protein [Streptomyces sp. YJ-C3]
MDDLAQWLGDQLDEDERIARATEWCAGTRTFNGWDAARTDEYEWEVRSRNAVIASGLNEEFVHHIVAHDPARVLREIEAKREIIRQADLYLCDSGPGCGYRTKHGHSVLRLLALPYADRPGYREEWRP